MAYSNDAKYVSLYNQSESATKERQVAEADMAFARSKYGGDSKEFIKAKARYDKAKPAAEAANKARLARLKEIDDADKAAKTKKDAAKTTKEATASASVTEFQLQAAKDKGDTAAVKALTAQLKAQQDKAKGIVPSGDGIKKPGDLAASPLMGYTIDASGTVMGTSGPVYLTSTVGIDGQSTVISHSSIAEARAEFLKGYSAPGQMDVLKQTLLAKHYINAKDVSAGDLHWVQKGVDTLIGKFTYDATSQMQFGKAKEPPTMASWLGSSASGVAVTGTVSKAGTKTQVDTTNTTIGDADTEINNFMMDSVGRPATVEEKKAFFAKITAAEKASGVSTAVTRNAAGDVLKTAQTGALVTADERTAIAVGIVQGALKGTTASALEASGKGSKIADDIATLQANSASYGKSLSAGEAYAIVQQGFGQKDYVAKQTERMRLNAMTIYGNLKQHIQDGGTVKDITDHYASLKATKLGIVIPDSLADKDVMGAVTGTNGLMSTADFTRQMQANPLWRQTEEAHNTAADFANTILKSFGLMG